MFWFYFNFPSEHHIGTLKDDGDEDFEYAEEADEEEGEPNGVNARLMSLSIQILY